MEAEFAFNFEFECFLCPALLHAEHEIFCFVLFFFCF